jgi:hypothetical protein
MNWIKIEDGGEMPEDKEKVLFITDKGELKLGRFYFLDSFFRPNTFISCDGGHFGNNIEYSTKVAMYLPARFLKEIPVR